MDVQPSERSTLNKWRWGRGRPEAGSQNASQGLRRAPDRQGALGRRGAPGRRCCRAAAKGCLAQGPAEAACQAQSPAAMRRGGDTICMPSSLDSMSVSRALISPVSCFHEISEYPKCDPNGTSLIVGLS